ncbi:MAG TPA: hypothetical protein VIY55_15380 [Acetobacteraceae bacterium]|jgi:hypothetical protein
MGLRYRVGMSSSTALAALSAGVVPSFAGAGPVQRVRALEAQPSRPTAQTMPAIAAQPGRDGDPAQGRILPRGSLLDLSV